MNLIFVQTGDANLRLSNIGQSSFRKEHHSMRTLATSLNFRKVLLDCTLLQELEIAVIGVLESTLLL